MDALPVGFTFVLEFHHDRYLQGLRSNDPDERPNMAANATGTLTMEAGQPLPRGGWERHEFRDHLGRPVGPGHQCSNTEFTGVTVVPLTSDLAITSATAAPARVLVGSDATFVVNVVNSGPDPATSTFLTDAVPNGSCRPS